MISVAKSVVHHSLGLIPRSSREAFFEYLLTQKPMSFSIELVNICNADCTFCAYRYQKRPKGIISDDVFQRAVDEYCSIGGGKLELTPTVGEPLLDKNLLKRVRYARSKKEIGEVGFYSNLLLLHHFDLDEFLNSGITHIRISACIKDEETYRKVYQAEGYPQLLKNIVNLCETNQRLGSPAKIELQLRVPQPFEAVRESRDFQLIAQYFDPKNIELEAHEFDSWSGQIKDQDLPQGNKVLKRHYDLSEGACYELYRKINVLYDGTVNFCICRDLNADFVIGNIMRQSLMEIWLGYELKKFREDWKQGIYPKMCLTCEKYLPVGQYQNQNRLTIVKKFLRYQRHQWIKDF